MAYSRINCPHCEKEFGQEKRFLRHLTDAHGIVESAYEAVYVHLYHGDLYPQCGCGCGVRLPWAGWKKGYTSRYLRGHNATVDSVYLDPERQKAFAKKRSKGYADGRYQVWNAGLTKETSDSLKRAAKKKSRTLREGYASGRHVPWQKGQTKETNVSVAKISETRKQRLATGEIKVWNDGLTKETDIRLQGVADAVSRHFKQREMGRRLKTPEFIERVLTFSDRFELVSSPKEYKTRRVDKLRFRCVECGEVQLKSLAMLEESPICFHCHPKGSTGQLELLNFVRSLGIEAINSDRTVIAPKELDVWVPSHRLGIEYNGLYYHSDLILGDKDHAIKKFWACREAGVNLFTIYEDEWRDRRNTVEGMIKHRLGLPAIKLNARSLRVAEIDTKIARGFFEENHLEGHARANHVLALLGADNVIYAAVSLRRPFHRKYAVHYELARSCCRLGHNVRGWLGRLTRAALNLSREHGRTGLLTYVDSRVGPGEAYKKAGWSLDAESTGARFWWTDFHERYNRFKYRADKSRNMTQAQVAVENGVHLIHGCPNSRWMITLCEGCHEHAHGE